MEKRKICLQDSTVHFKILMLFRSITMQHCTMHKGKKILQLFLKAFLFLQIIGLLMFLQKFAGNTQKEKTTVLGVNLLVSPCRAKFSGNKLAP
jgi:predicted permease